MKTAVEWYAARIHDIEFKKSVGAISVIEYYEELTKALEQAKEMERQHIIKAVYDSMGTNFDPNMGRAEQYYNENYGK
jgi:hypothetical protein